MKRYLLLGALCAALLAPSAAQAQDQWVRQVRAQLEQAGGMFRSQGYTMTHHFYTGSLNDGAEETVEVNLESGNTYQIMGACDTDCTDLDIQLLDGNGDQVDIDIEADDFPIVTVSVTGSGRFTMRVMMAECSAEPCRYGVGVWGK